MTETLEVTSASENVLKYLGFADAEVLKVKARLAAELIRIMRERRLPIRATAKLAGVDASDIARIRNVDLDRFTIDRLLRTVHRLDDRVRLQVTQTGEGEAA